VAKQIWAFLGLAFAVSWMIWIAAIRLGAGLGSSEYVLAFGSAGPAVAAIFLSYRNQPTPAPRVLGRVISFVAVWLLAWFDGSRGTQPSYRTVVALLALIPAWVVSGALSRDTGVRQLLQTLVERANLRWSAVGLFFFPVLLLVPAAILKPFGATLAWPYHRDSVSAYVFQGAVLFLNSLLFTAVLEEPGWRGFLLPRLQQRFSPLLASILVWLPWALWHAPLDFSGGVGKSWLRYLEIRVVFLIPIAIILTWLYNRSGGNLLAVALFHAGMNTFPVVLPYAPKMLGLIFVVAIYVIVRERMWRPILVTSGPSAQIPGTLEAAG
jgi:uncharacterized protein